MKIAINETVTGKELNKKKDWTYKFKVVDWTYKEIGDHIKQGKPICNNYSLENLNINNIAKSLGYEVTKEIKDKIEEGKTFWRKGFCFRSADFIGLDFDNKEGDEYFDLKNELLAGDTERAKFILNKSFLIYTSPSHKKSHHKFRVLFHLPKQVSNIDEYVRLQKLFESYFTRADRNTIKRTIFFFGTSGLKNSWIKVTNNRLQETDINNLELKHSKLKAKQESKREKKQESKQESKREKKPINKQIYKANKAVESKQKIDNTNNQTKQETAPDEIFSMNVISILSKQTYDLKEAKIGERDNILNRVCFIFGSVFSGVEKEGRILRESELIEDLKEIGYKLGELDNFKSLTRKKINDTVDRAIREGKKEPMDFAAINQKEKDLNYLHFEGFTVKKGKLIDKARKKARELIKDTQFLKENFKEIKKNYESFKAGDQDFVKIIAENKLIKMSKSDLNFDNGKRKSLFSNDELTKMIVDSRFNSYKRDVKLSDLLEKYVNDETGRLFANKAIPEMFQIPKLVNTHLNKVYKEEITENKKRIAVDNGLAVFDTFGIAKTKDSLTIEFINQVCNNFTSQKAKQYYFALWRYASEQGSPYFDNVNINEIIKKMYLNKEISKQELYRERKQFIDSAKLFGNIIFFKESETEEKGITDITKISLIENFQIRNIKKVTYFTGRLPRSIDNKQLNIGDYLPNAIFKFSGDHKGAYNLTEALMREANRIMIGENKKGVFRTPDFDEIPIRWTKERVLKEIKTINTPNVTRKNELLKEVFKSLKKYRIIKSFSGIPKRDKTEIKIVVFNSKK